MLREHDVRTSLRRCDFQIDDLAAAKAKTVPWFGVRNYQARNYMRDDMKIGDEILFGDIGDVVAVLILGEEMVEGLVLRRAAFFARATPRSWSASKKTPSSGQWELPSAVPPVRW